MSTLGSLMSLLGETGIKPYNEQELTENRIRGGQISNQTGLLELAALRRQQETAAQARAYFAANPQALFGDQQVPQSTLGSLAPAGGGPLTQQTTAGGQPPGVPQMVPGGQDLSRFATQGGPPQSTLASLAPGPQANPLMDLARRNPDAAMAVQQRMQAQQDFDLKRQEQRLTMGTKVAEYVGRIAQGVTDQASLDAARQELARVHPQAAAQLPQTYSQEAMAPFIAKANSVLENQTLQVGEMKAQIEARKLQMQAANIPNYTGDANLDAAIYQRMKGQPVGSMPSADVVEAARNDVQQGKVTVSAQQGSAAGQQRTLSEAAQKRLDALNTAAMTAQSTTQTLAQVDALINSTEGVYGDSPEARLAMARYNIGTNPSDQRARNTALLRTMGAKLVLERGSLGTGVSNADRELYEKAAGQFQSAQNVEQMKQAIAIMRPILRKSMAAADRAEETWRTEGRLPRFLDEPPAQGAPPTGTTTGAAPKPGAPPPQPGKVISRAVLEKAASAQNMSLDEAITLFQADGYTIK
jgi:hypothetical protein